MSIYWQKEERLGIIAHKYLHFQRNASFIFTYPNKKMLIVRWQHSFLKCPAISASESFSRLDWSRGIKNDTATENGRRCFICEIIARCRRAKNKHPTDNGSLCNGWNFPDKLPKSTKSDRSANPWLRFCSSCCATVQTVTMRRYLKVHCVRFGNGSRFSVS